MQGITKASLSAIFVLFLLAGVCRADGFIVLHRPRPEVRPVPLAVKFHHVDVKIHGQLATTTVDQVFVNPNAIRLEGTYYFPLPQGAALSGMSMWIDGKEAAGEMLPRDKAAAIYTDIVRRMKDPAILEYMGSNLFRMRVFPIEAKGEKRIKIIYSETVGADNSLCTYRYPLSTEKFSSSPLEDLAIRVEIEGELPLKTVFSPSHEVEVVKKDDHRAVVGLESRDVLPRKDFVLYYSFSDKDIGATLAAFRRSGEDGYFALFMAPKQDVSPGETVAKDVVFAIDTSGSMKEPSRRPWKIDQAKAALEFCVKSLGGKDRFDIVSFATAARKFRDGLVPATEEFTQEALAFIEAMKAGGGTNIQAALEDALSLQENKSKRPFMIVFLTDGLPTVGEIQDAGGLISLVKKKAGEATRLFAFGVGYDVNTRLLDRISLDNRGERVYVSPDENIEVKVSGFFEKISCPVLSDVALSISDIETYDIFPPRPPDLFKGSQLVLYGRYKGSGQKTVTLSGQVNGKPARFVYEVSFPERSLEQSNLPRLWATTKVGYLLEQLRLKGIDVASGRVPEGPGKEIVDEVVRLAVDFGIVTPYTALLVLEDSRRSGRPAAPLAGRLAALEKEKPAAEKAMNTASAGFAADSGKKSVGQSLALKRLRRGRLPAAAGAEADDFSRAFDASRTVRVVKDKTFFLVDGVWQDSLFRKGMETKKIPFLSEDYFELLAKQPGIAPYFSAGSRVIVCFEGSVYEIIAGGAPPRSPASPR